MQKKASNIERIKELSSEISKDQEAQKKELLSCLERIHSMVKATFEDKDEICEEIRHLIKKISS
jgi:hypothetical protein